MEDLLPLARRKRLFDSLGFGEAIEFDRGDIGVAGGLEVSPHISDTCVFLHSDVAITHRDCNGGVVKLFRSQTS
jgi:hypothetical protein